jgi:hypothetical protein
MGTLVEVLLFTLSLAMDNNEFDHGGGGGGSGVPAAATAMVVVGVDNRDRWWWCLIAAKALEVGHATTSQRSKRAT